MTAATPCAQCSGHCCTRYSIEVTVSDLARLTSALEIPAAQLCDTVPSWAGRCPIAPSYIGGQPVNIVISKRDTGCRFYRDGVGANCSVYGIRPRSCAVFPYFGGAGAVLLREGLPCPAPWSAEQQPAAVGTDLDRLMADIAVHNHLVHKLEEHIDSTIDLAGYLELLLDAFVAAG